MFTAIMEIFALIAHLWLTSVRVAGPGGVRAVIAESLLLKHQLIVLNRARNRAPRADCLGSAPVRHRGLLGRPQSPPELRLESGRRRCCAFTGRPAPFRCRCY